MVLLVLSFLLGLCLGVAVTAGVASRQFRRLAGESRACVARMEKYMEDKKC
jgi:hypothetical protein